MRRLITVLFFVLVSVASPAIAAPLPWVVLGDSFESNGGVANVTAAQVDIHLVERERNVQMRNISSAGAMMGAPWPNGYRGATYTYAILDHVCGAMSQCAGVLVQAGINDFSFPGVSWANVADSMNDVMVWARSRGKKVIVLDLAWGGSLETAPANHMGYTFADYRLARAVTCALNPDVCYYFPRNPALNVYNPSYYVSASDPHPTAAGHRARADWIKAGAAFAGLF